MSTELKRVKKMHPNLAQKDVMRQAAANWQKRKLSKPIKKMKKIVVKKM
jgi:hypothetical protein